MAVVGELVVLITGSHIPLLGSIAKSEAAMTSWGARAGVLMVGIGAAAAVIGVKAIESASKFEDAMLLIETQAGGSRAEVEAMTTAILKLAPSVATGPLELAEALYHIESTGHRGADALDILTTSAKLAKVGNADLEDTTNALLAATNSGIGGFTGMSQAAGILNSIVGSGNMRMEELTAAIGSGFFSTAATFGVTLQSLGASLATMTAAGLPAEESATKLRMTMSLLGAPSNKAIKELSKIGLSSTDLANAMRGPDGILGAIRMLHEHLQGLDPTAQAALLSRAFGGGRSSGAIMALLGLIEQFPIIQQQVIDGAGNLDAAWLRTSQDASFRWEQVGVSIDVVVKAIGLALLPAVENLLGVIVPVVSAFAQWATDNPQVLTTVLAIAGAVGALAVAAALLGPLIGVIAVLASPLGLTFLLIAAAITLVVANMDNLARGIQVVIDKINEFIGLAQSVPGAKLLGDVGDLNTKSGGNANAAYDAYAAQHPELNLPMTVPPIGKVPGTVGGLSGDGLIGQRRGESVKVTHITNVHLDGKKVGEAVEHITYNNASAWNSGFSNPGPDPIR